jgi:hypothetical protein
MASDVPQFVRVRVPLTRRQVLKNSLGWGATGLVLVIPALGVFALWVWLADMIAGHWWAVPVLLAALLPFIAATLMLLLGGVALVNAVGLFWCFLTARSVYQEVLRPPPEEEATDGVTH